MAPFVPTTPERYFTVKITGREAQLVQKLRRYAFGKFVVQKANGLLIRLEIQESQMIDGEGGIDLT